MKEVELVLESQVSSCLIISFLIFFQEVSKSFVWREGEIVGSKI